MEYQAKHVASYIEDTFTQYEGLTEQWAEHGEEDTYYFDGYNNEGDNLEVKVTIVGTEWAVEERMEDDEDWILADIFSISEGVIV